MAECYLVVAPLRRTNTGRRTFTSCGAMKHYKELNLHKEHLLLKALELYKKSKTTYYKNLVKYINNKCLSK